MKSSEDLNSRAAETTHISESVLLSPSNKPFNNSLMRRSKVIMKSDNLKDGEQAQSPNDGDI